MECKSCKDIRQLILKTIDTVKATQQDMTNIREYINNQEREVYVVVTEDWYGGIQKIKAFNTKEKAEAYSNEIGTQNNLDTIVLKLTVQ